MINLYDKLQGILQNMSPEELAGPITRYELIESMSSVVKIAEEMYQGDIAHLYEKLIELENFMRHKGAD